MRRAGSLDRRQPVKATDAMIDMDDEIARRQHADLGDEILRAARLFAAADEAVAENVLLADNGQVRRFETRFEPDHGQRNGRLRRAQSLAEGRNRLQRPQAEILQHMAETLARAFRPAGDDDALALRL